MNVLLTSAGRRTGLLAAFLGAARPGGKVVAADASPLAPCLYLADAGERTPRINDPEYLAALEAICERHEVGLVVPCIDTELELLSLARPRFLNRGVQVAISEPAVIELAGDKWKTCTAFANLGLPTPRSWLPHALPEGLEPPLFIKPRGGSASEHAHKVESLAELDFHLTRVPDPIVQEFLPWEEVTVDALLDLRGEVIHYVPRRRIRTLGGESIQSVTLDNAMVDGVVMGALEALRELGARGPLTLQVFLGPEGPILSEVNPRFGGGAPLAFAAGGDYPRWLLESARGEHPAPRLGEYERGLYMTRAYGEQFLRELLP